MARGREQTPPPALEVTSLAAGGAGIARWEGRVVFVAGGLPGDICLVQIDKDHGRFLTGRATKVLAPSPARVEPACAVAERCGGCPWMALEPQAQLRAKEDIVRDALARIGGLPPEVVAPIQPSPRILGYRRRARLYLEGGRLGYHARGSHEIVDVHTCPVLEPALAELLEPLRRSAPPTLRRGPLQVELDLSEGGGRRIALSGAGAAAWSRGLLGLLTPELRDTTQLFVDDQPAGSQRGRRLPFLQANVAANQALIDRTVEGLGEVTRVLDLFCGSGNFSAPLLERGIQVVGMEYDQAAIDKARQLPGAAQRGEFLVGDVAELLPQRLRAGEPFDGVVINPPRTGAAQVVKLLDGQRLKVGVYVSCDPATLARDLASMAPTWEVVRVFPFDLMPHTAHVESVAWLRARGRA